MPGGDVIKFADTIINAACSNADFSAPLLCSAEYLESCAAPHSNTHTVKKGWDLNALGLENGLDRKIIK